MYVSNVNLDKDYLVSCTCETGLMVHLGSTELGARKYSL